MSNQNKGEQDKKSGMSQGGQTQQSGGSGSNAPGQQAQGGNRMNANDPHLENRGGPGRDQHNTDRDLRHEAGSEANQGATKTQRDTADSRHQSDQNSPIMGQNSGKAQNSGDERDQGDRNRQQGAGGSNTGMNPSNKK